MCDHLFIRRLGVDDLNTGQPRPTMRGVAQEVAERHRLTLNDLTGSSRRRPFVRPRQEAMYEMMRVQNADGEWRWSTPQIGMLLGGRDHTTVLHGMRAHAKRKGLPVIVRQPARAE